MIPFDGLIYATYQYIVIVTRLEMIYCNILSEKYIVALGANIADQIRVVLMGKAVSTDWLVEFVPPDTAPQYVTGIDAFLLLIYLRMRGKDFGMKLL